MIFDTENCKCFNCNYVFDHGGEVFLCQCTYSYISIRIDVYDHFIKKYSCYDFIKNNKVNLIRIDSKDFKINLHLNLSLNKVIHYEIFHRNDRISLNQVDLIYNSIYKIKYKEYNLFSELYYDIHKEYDRAINNLVFL